MSATLDDKPVGFLLVEMPEAFQDLDSGEIHETYRLDGTTIGFPIGSDGADLRFENLTLHLYKAAENTVSAIYLDLLNVPGSIFNQFGPITGMPIAGDAVADDSFVNVRLVLRPGVQDLVESALVTGSAPTLSHFLSLTKADGSPVFWDFHSYYTESLMET